MSASSSYSSEVRRHRTCHHAPVSREQQNKWIRNVTNFRTHFESATTSLGVPVVYRVLHRTNAENIAFEFIKANHVELNKCFSGTNDDISRVPNSGNYGFAKPLVGNPKIVLMPEDASTLVDDLPSVTRTEFSGEDLTLTSALRILPPIPGWLNIYIGPMISSLLGEAELGSNICMVTTGSVGSPTMLGEIENFNAGRTAVHEVGHCFTLFHPFDAQCVFQINDLPKTKTPNRDATLDFNGQDGNHDMDVKGITQNTSCSGNAAPPVGFYELFMTYMEYVVDRSMVMFTQGQSEAMFVWVDTEGRDILSIQDDNFSELPGQATPAPATDGSSGLSTTQIVLIVIGSLIGVALIAIIIYFAVKSSK